QKLKFDKILLDAPCSGEGTMRSSVKTCLMWNPNTIKSLSKLQKKLFQKAFEILNEGGEMVYSTCTHAPEENEEVVDFALSEFKGRIEIIKLALPVKFREGITSWENEKYDEKVKKSCRIYPQDNDTEGFFIAKFKKIK
ncbi:MAG: RsmB/NOP family class I SAM-dependent RNA methyltransferase, partial [Nanoarchaeota archaeon]